MNESILDALLWVLLILTCLAVMAFLVSLLVPCRPWHGPRRPLVMSSALLAVIAAAANQRQL